MWIGVQQYITDNKTTSWSGVCDGTCRLVPSACAGTNDADARVSASHGYRRDTNRYVTLKCDSTEDFTKGIRTPYSTDSPFKIHEAYF